MQILKVAGDHRVGIFAKEGIKTGVNYSMMMVMHMMKHLVGVLKHDNSKEGPSARAKKPPLYRSLVELTITIE